MSKKQEQDALTSLAKLEELTQDILKNSTDGGDQNFRQIIFSGLTQTKNEILLSKMRDLLFVDTETDLKKSIILGIFVHKEMFEPVIEYGESVVNMPYIDESYDEKESFLFVLDALIELSYKKKLNDFESGVSMLMQLFKIACSEKSSSVLADKLLQRFLNSKIGTVKLIQDEFVELIKDTTSGINEVVIALNILTRVQYAGVLNLIQQVLDRIIAEPGNLQKYLPLLDVATLSVSCYTDAKSRTKVKKLLDTVEKIDLSEISDKDTVSRIEKRMKKIRENINSQN